jgi:hypothetical protein
MNLYHREIGLPAGFSFWQDTVWNLEYTRHALQAILTDRYGAPKRMPKTIAFPLSEVVEVAVEGGRVSKVVVRVTGSRDFVGPRPDMDLCLVLIRGEDDDNNVLWVKTCWFNERADTHKTLDASKYTRP